MLRGPLPPPPITPAMQAYDFAHEYVMKAALSGTLVSAQEAYRMWDALTTLYIERRKLEQNE